VKNTTRKNGLTISASAQAGIQFGMGSRL
jgi:hypothetical protein